MLAQYRHPLCQESPLRRVIRRVILRELSISEPRKPPGRSKTLAITGSGRRPEGKEIPSFSDTHKKKQRKQ
jgi:hypothetical protein